MKDTSAAMEARYRDMLMRRPGSERLKMGCSMLATARALARAAVQARDPSVSPASLRRELFLHFYRGDFATSDQLKILTHLEAPEPHRR
jgi:hypothetical protein